MCFFVQVKQNCLKLSSLIKNSFITKLHSSGRPICSVDTQCCTGLWYAEGSSHKDGEESRRRAKVAGLVDQHHGRLYSKRCWKVKAVWWQSMNPTPSSRVVSCDGMVVYTYYRQGNSVNSNAVFMLLWVLGTDTWLLPEGQAANNFYFPAILYLKKFWDTDQTNSKALTTAKGVPAGLIQLNCLQQNTLEMWSSPTLE